MQTRQKLIDLVVEQNKTVSSASKLLKLKASTAKVIVSKALKAKDARNMYDTREKNSENFKEFSNF